MFEGVLGFTPPVLTPERAKIMLHILQNGHLINDGQRWSKESACALWADLPDFLVSRDDLFALTEKGVLLANLLRAHETTNDETLLVVDEERLLRDVDDSFGGLRAEAIHILRAMRRQKVFKSVSDLICEADAGLDFIESTQALDLMAARKLAQQDICLRWRAINGR